MAKEKTTMSVSEMQHMLGLKKTDSYGYRSVLTHPGR